MTLPDTSEKAGFDRVYRRHLLPITRLAFLLVRSQAVAEDLAHDAFVRLYEHRDDVHNPPGFVRTVVVRLAIRWQERDRLERDRLAVVGGEDRGVGAEAPEVDEMWDALGRLAPERATVLVLRYYADLAYDEIAGILGCSAATARSRA
ncbi:MAG TPA: sigma-70 family RNA polymerase sigma factor, partial [Acidimicrobiales bacterium]